MSTRPIAAPEAARRTPAYQEEFETWGLFRLLPIDPVADAAVLHGWVTAERARFWGMSGYTVAEVREVYEFLAGLDTHHAYLIDLAGEPFGIFQTYQAIHDPVGEAYPALPGDTGTHLLLGPASRFIPHFTPVLAAALTRFVFADPGTERIIAEPDARNGKAIRRLLASSFELGPVVQLADKEAQLAFLTPAMLAGN
ncbi:GNAT family N-acetyltransferase [Pseudarthrobacter sp. MEB009]|uniref:GNAT family N-acetyltransferase n=1 Tax=Pseudarthrobacter sp. MEB009 TaxID=3040326 RepID=UPI00255463E3|nr:GNAT family N-acetyltransferase [Pseudarthrobacter sp. MEB009]